MSVTLLDMDAEPVGGWWPDDVGEPVASEEGPLHPRVGTVVGVGEDAPVGVIIDTGAGGLWVRRSGMPYSHVPSWACMTPRVPLEVMLAARVCGATILYWPLDKP